MSKNKGGRKPLGTNKRTYCVKVRFNETELAQVISLMTSYQLHHKSRGTVGPFLRRIILNEAPGKENQLPDSFSKLIFQINKIGVNINQLTKVVAYKNKRSPNADLRNEIEKANTLLLEIFTLVGNTNSR